MNTMMQQMRRALRIAATSGLMMMASTSVVSAQQAAPLDPNDPSGPLVGPGPGPGALAPSQVDARLTMLLSGYESFPTRVELDALAGAGEITRRLIAMTADGALAPHLRLRAIDALGMYPEPDSRGALRAIAGRETAQAPRAQLRVARAMRRHAVLALARAGGAEELGALTPLLSHADFQLQMTAVSAIGKHTGAPGKPALRTLRDRTTDPVLLAELRKHL